MIHKDYFKLMEKYSFIDKVEVQLTKVIFTYKSKGVTKTKILPRRATKHQLQRAISSIRKELGVSIYGKGKNQEIFIA